MCIDDVTAAMLGRLVGRVLELQSEVRELHAKASDMYEYLIDVGIRLSEKEYPEMKRDVLSSEEEEV